MGKFFIEKENSALLIVDIQEKLAAVMAEKDKVIANITHLVEAAKLFGLPVIVTEQYPKGLGPTVKELRDCLPSYSPIEKLTFSCLKENAFLEALAACGKKRIILTGMETHICVLQTALGLINSGYAVHVVKDAVTSRARENFDTGIELMRDAGAVITCTETVLFQLLERAGTPAFKIISQRIK